MSTTTENLPTENKSPIPTEASLDSPVYTGVIKWFNDSKGYGFIQADAVDGDIFVHYSSIDSEGFKTLQEGEAVKFQLMDGPKGPHAVEVKRNSGNA